MNPFLLILCVTSIFASEDALKSKDALTKSFDANVIEPDEKSTTMDGLYGDRSFALNDTATSPTRSRLLNDYSLERPAWQVQDTFSCHRQFDGLPENPKEYECGNNDKPLFWRYREVTLKPEAIIISYYGGYTKDRIQENGNRVFFSSNLKEAIQRECPFMLQGADSHMWGNHVNYFQVITHDINSNIHQKDQFDAESTRNDFRKAMAGIQNRTKALEAKIKELGSKNAELTKILLNDNSEDPFKSLAEQQKCEAELKKAEEELSVRKKNYERLKREADAIISGPLSMNDLIRREKLLPDTLIQLISFVRNVKRKFPNVPIFYYGMSFGGTKGALLNFILSNWNDLDNVLSNDFVYLAERLKSFGLTPQDKDLFAGFILHGGDFLERPGRKSLTNAIQKYETTIPMLLLHAFDDERSPIGHSLGLFDKVWSQNKNPYLHFFMIPQAAASVGQGMSQYNTMNTSTEGHGLPKREKYLREYMVRVNLFMKKCIEGKPDFASDLSYARYLFCKNLYFGTNSTQDDTQDDTKAYLLRLYFARLHNPELQNNPNPEIEVYKTLESRVFETIREYAIFKARMNKLNAQKALENIFFKDGLWLCETIKRLTKLRFNAIRSSLDKSLEERGFFKKMDLGIF